MRKNELKKQHVKPDAKQMQESVCTELDCLWKQTIKEHWYMLPVLRDAKVFLVAMVNDHM
jgi:hypothetical protein